MAHPHVAGAGYLLASVPFLLIFVLCILADLNGNPLPPSRNCHRLGLLAAYILWSLQALIQIPRG